MIDNQHGSFGEESIQPRASSYQLDDDGKLDADKESDKENTLLVKPDQRECLKNASTMFVINLYSSRLKRVITITFFHLSL